MPTESHAPPPYQSYGTDDPGDLGGFQNLCGDPYGDRDDVTRGVSLADPPSGALGFIGMGSADLYGGKLGYTDDFLSDFPMPAQYTNGFGGKDFNGFFDQGCIGTIPEPLGKKAFGDSSLSDCRLGTEPSARFPENASPPSVPDPLYSFDDSTTLHVSLGMKYRPSKLGNDLLDFFEGRVDSRVIKVRHHKFAIKARVFADGLNCTVKVKVFVTSCNAYAIEFQRRGGDSLTFAKAFKKAAKYLNDEQFYQCAAGSEAGSFDVPSVLAVPPVEHAGQPPCADDHDFGQLPDMAGLVGPLLDFPGSQAEAAAALLDAASDPASATSLCSDKAFEKMRLLLEESKEEIAYPMSQVLLQLSQCQSAIPWLKDEHLLLSIVRVVSNASCSLVKKELAKVIEAVVQRCVDFMHANTKEQLTHELFLAEGKMNMMGMEAQAAQHLARARELVTITLIS